MSAGSYSGDVTTVEKRLRNTEGVAVLRGLQSLRLRVSFANDLSIIRNFFKLGNKKSAIFLLPSSLSRGKWTTQALIYVSVQLVGAIMSRMLTYSLQTTELGTPNITAGDWGDWGSGTKQISG